MIIWKARCPAINILSLRRDRLVTFSKGVLKSWCDFVSYLDYVVYLSTLRFNTLGNNVMFLPQFLHQTISCFVLTVTWFSFVALRSDICIFSVCITTCNKYIVLSYTSICFLTVPASIFLYSFLKWSLLLIFHFVYVLD